MTQLTTEIKNNIIIFKDGSKKWIEDSVYKALLELGEGEKFTIDGQLYDFNTVSKILTRQEYYEEYPENSPMFREFFEPEKYVDKKDRRRVLGLILGGFRGYLDKSGGYDKLNWQTQKLLKIMEERYDKAGKNIK